MGVISSPSHDVISGTFQYLNIIVYVAFSLLTETTETFGGGYIEKNRQDSI